jgi:hypothetical protein
MCHSFFKKKLCKISKENAIFKYLLVKSLCDILVLLECLTKLLVKCESCTFSKTYFMCLLSLLTEDYFKQVFRMLSILCQICAALLVYIRVKNIAIKWAQSHLTQLITIIFMVLSVMLFYIYEFYEEVISEVSENVYELVKTNFRFSQLNFYLTLVQGVFRDIICVFVIFIINVLILIEFNRIIIKKRSLIRLNNQSDNLLRRKNRDVSARQNDSKLRLIIKMVFYCSIQTTFGHIPLFFKYFSVFKEDKCFVQITKLLYVLSVSTNFFIYFFFNSVFKSNIYRIFSSKL